MRCKSISKPMRIGLQSCETWRRTVAQRPYTSETMGHSEHPHSNFMILIKVSFLEAALGEYHSVVFLQISQQHKKIGKGRKPLEKRLILEAQLMTRKMGRAAIFQRIDEWAFTRSSRTKVTFSDSLICFYKSDLAHCKDENAQLDVLITTPVIQKRKDLLNYVFWYLLEIHRREEHPARPLTSLRKPNKFRKTRIGEDYGRSLRQYTEAFQGGRRESKGCQEESWSVLSWITAD